MKKKLTLEQAWRYCLAMWKWIAKEIKQDKTLCPWSLKHQWMREHPQFGRLKDSCFFCEYALRHRDSASDDDCAACPGRLVSKSFNCEGYRTYSWFDEPVAFYNRIVGLNKRRKAKEQGWYKQLKYRD